MIRLALVEDTPADIALLQSHIEQYKQETGLELVCDVFTDGAMLVESYTKDYDMIIMDIEMPLLNGMEAAAEIRKRDDGVIIVFVTNSQEYAVKGYEVGALDYLLKPLNYFAFSQRLQRALVRLNTTIEQYIVIRVNREIQRLNVADITYIESDKHKLIYHTTKGQFVTNDTIKRAVSELPKRFVKGNSGCLINLQHVDAIKNGCAMVGEDSIPLSRSRKADFQEAFLRHIGEN